MIFYQKKNHWSWGIPVSDTATSIGLVVPADYFKSLGLSREEFLRTEMQRLNPDLTRRVGEVKFAEEVRSITTFSYEAKNYTGPGFICVGDSHRFTDPIFSFGVFLAMKEAAFAVDAIAESLSSESTEENPYAAYEALTTQGQDAAQDLIDCFWEFPLVFQRMAHTKAPDDITDLFAGRFYGDAVEKNVSRQAMRRLLAAKRMEQVAA